MLYKKAVEPRILELLKSLQAADYLKGFCLAGGTALALYNGHRKSVDIDLFSDFEFDAGAMMENISRDHNFSLWFSAASTLKGAINNINVDIIAHRYRLINPPVAEENIILLSEPDIAAMKLNAICTSGQRIKDFIDLCYLLRKYNIDQLLGFYRTKYNQDNDLLVLKSLIYFDDVEESEWPVMLSDPHIRWKDIRKEIEKEVVGYSRKAGLA